MTYDDAGWHQDSVGEHGLDPDCAATHIGMFFAWLAYHDLVDTERTNTAPLLARSITPGKFLIDHCCGEINSADVTARGAAFCEAAYRQYLRVYDAIPEIARCEVSYAAPDTWETYDAVAPVIQEAYEVFRHGGN